MSVGSQKKESKSLDKSPSKRLRKRLSLLKRDNATKFSPLSISQCNHEKVEKALLLLMVLRARPFAKLLPAHTHTPQSAAGLVGLVVVVGLLKKVMCTYRNLGIFTSPFRPL